MRDTIVTKALKCIDEIYPDENTLNEGYLPTDAFIDEAVRWVIDNAPTHLLTTREYGVDVANFENKDGVVELEVVDNGRIVYVKCADWHRPVFDLISEQNPLYRQQMNKVLRGNPTRPVVVRKGHASNGGDYTLELYTTNATDDGEVDIQVVPYNVESIPTYLADITAWKLAEIVLMSMSDVQAASVCTARVNEHLQQLSL